MWEFVSKMQYYLLPIYILLGILPSSVWLFYYLNKDLHPEPKKMILKIFFYGSIVTLPVFIVQIGSAWLLERFHGIPFFISYPIVPSLLKWFFIIALTEELGKYIVVKFGVLNSYLVDEPLDIMLYMVVAALGFGAVENILYLFSSLYGLFSFDSIVITAIAVIFIRFVGATFLHTLCSGLVGYFLAMASFHGKKKVLLTICGLSLAAILHGLYNFSITAWPWPFNVITPTMVILALALFMLYDFDQIKKIKGICKL